MCGEGVHQISYVRRRAISGAVLNNMNYLGNNRLAKLQTQGIGTIGGKFTLVWE